MSKCIIYCNTIQRVINLTNAMCEDGFPTVCLHGRMSEEERKEAFTQFRSEGARVLISSDITARGIDVQQVSAVINLDLPRKAHTYLHRIGRSGRWGRKGIAVNFVTYSDMHTLKEIERYYNTEINEFTVPT